MAWMTGVERDWDLSSAQQVMPVHEVLWVFTFQHRTGQATGCIKFVVNELHLCYKGVMKSSSSFDTASGVITAVVFLVNPVAGIMALLTLYLVIPALFASALEPKTKAGKQRMNDLQDIRQSHLYLRSIGH